MLTVCCMHLQRAIDLGFVCSVCLSIFCEVCLEHPETCSLSALPAWASAIHTIRAPLNACACLQNLPVCSTCGTEMKAGRGSATKRKAAAAVGEGVAAT